MADPNPTLDRILVALRGAERVLDIGCGDGALTGALTRRGFAVTGIDPQEDRITQARARYPDAQFVVAPAEMLSLKGPRHDAAIFLNALHHVPQAMMGDAMNATIRAVRPGGVLVVIEPLAQGGFFEAMRPVDDETNIRADALAALDRLTQTDVCTLIDQHQYDRISRFAGLEEFLTYLRAADPARTALIESRHDAVAQAFAKNATPNGAAFTLIQPMAIWVFQTRSDHTSPTN